MGIPARVLCRFEMKTGFKRCPPHSRPGSLAPIQRCVAFRKIRRGASVPITPPRNGIGILTRWDALLQPDGIGRCQAGCYANIRACVQSLGLIGYLGQGRISGEPSLHQFPRRRNLDSIYPGNRAKLLRFGLRSLRCMAHGRSQRLERERAFWRDDQRSMLRSSPSGSGICRHLGERRIQEHRRGRELVFRKRSGAG